MELRDLVIELLDDDNGISLGAWELLQMFINGDDSCDDIIEAVEISEGRVYLPECWDDGDDIDDIEISADIKEYDNDIES